jgi:hypothetical protein
LQVQIAQIEERLEFLPVLQRVMVILAKVFRIDVLVKVHHLPDHFARVWLKQLEDTHPQDFGAAVTGDSLHGLVYRPEVAFQVVGINDVSRVLEKLAILALARHCT